MRKATAAAALLTLGIVGVAHGQANWPEKQVTVVVPFGAGGNTDMMARLAAQHLSAKFGQSFVIENRPSAGGALGTGQVAAAAPDGYTLLFAAASMIVLTPLGLLAPGHAFGEDAAHDLQRAYNKLVVGLSKLRLYGGGFYSIHEGKRANLLLYRSSIGVFGH